MSILITKTDLSDWERANWIPHPTLTDTYVFEVKPYPPRPPIPRWRRRWNRIRGRIHAARRAVGLRIAGVTERDLDRDW